MDNSKQKKNDRASIVVSVILCVLFIPIIVFNILMIAKTYIEPEHIPGLFGLKPVIVLSGSMSPVFETNSLILIKETDTSKLQEGDIICYLTDGAAVTHRIEQVITDGGQTRYITRGDANNTSDRLAVSPEQVEGVYIGKIDKLGAFGMFLQSTTGMAIFVILPVLLYLLWDVLRRMRQSKRESSRAERLEAELERLRAERQEAPENSIVKEDVAMK